MPIFVIFIFGSIVLGAGAMLAPAIPTNGPRIGLAATLALAIVVVGAIGYAALFGWDTLVIDYLWFALLVGIFLTGTLSAGMFRSEAQGGIKDYSGWPGPRELAFFGMIAIVFSVPALILPVPLDTDAQGFGYLGLTMKLGGGLTTLSPFHPEIHWLYSPALPALIAYLGTQLNAGLHTIQLAIGAVVGLLFVWVAYDFGNEIDLDESRRLGNVMAVCAFIGTGLLTAMLDSHYSALLGLTFSLAFLTFVLRFSRYGKRIDLLAAAVTLAAVPLSQPDMTIVLILGYVPALLTIWAVRPRPTVKRWLGLAVAIPAFALLLITPWIAKILPLLGSEIQSPFEISGSHLLVMVAYHGGVIVILSIIGIVIGLKHRNWLDWMMFVWLILIADFSSIGILKALLPALVAPITRFDYPFSIAWHGPIIPYVYFGAQGILWLANRIGMKRAERWNQALALPIINIIALIAVLIMGFVDPLLAFSKTLPVAFFGTFSSKADVQAMLWLKQNTMPKTLILNYPGEQEGDWVPVISQRNSVYYRWQPFFRGTENSAAQQKELLAFWRNPSDPANIDLLAKYNIQYVIVPQYITNPTTIKTMFRWRVPRPEAIADYHAVSETPFLQLVFDQDGAQVYKVIYEF
jgi:hypothetical protein